GRRPFARLTAHGRFPDKKGCKTADQAGSRVASAQWRSDKNHPTDFRPVSKEQFLAKILARFRRERHFVRRSAENLHPKLIAAVSQKQPADAAAHAVSGNHHGFEFGKLLFHLIDLLAQDCSRIRKWITSRVAVTERVSRAVLCWPPSQPQRWEHQCHRALCARSHTFRPHRIGRPV